MMGPGGPEQGGANEPESQEARGLRRWLANRSAGERHDRERPSRAAAEEDAARRAAEALNVIYADAIRLDPPAESSPMREPRPMPAPASPVVQGLLRDSWQPGGVPEEQLYQRATALSPEDLSGLRSWLAEDMLRGLDTGVYHKVRDVLLRVQDERAGAAGVADNLNKRPVGPELPPPAWERLPVQPPRASHAAVPSGPAEPGRMQGAVDGLAARFADPQERLRDGTEPRTGGSRAGNRGPAASRPEAPAAAGGGASGGGDGPTGPPTGPPASPAPGGEPRPGDGSEEGERRRGWRERREERRDARNAARDESLRKFLEPQLDIPAEGTPERTELDDNFRVNFAAAAERRAQQNRPTPPDEPAQAHGERLPRRRTENLDATEIASMIHHQKVEPGGSPSVADLSTPAAYRDILAHLQRDGVVGEMGELPRWTKSFQIKSGRAHVQLYPVEHEPDMALVLRMDPSGKKRLGGWWPKKREYEPAVMMLVRTQEVEGPDKTKFTPSAWEPGKEGEMKPTKALKSIVEASIVGARTRPNARGKSAMLGIRRPPETTSNVPSVDLGMADAGMFAERDRRLADLGRARAASASPGVPSPRPEDNPPGPDRFESYLGPMPTGAGEQHLQDALKERERMLEEWEEHDQALDAWRERDAEVARAEGVPLKPGSLQSAGATENEDGYAHAPGDAMARRAARNIVEPPEGIEDAPEGMAGLPRGLRAVRPVGSPPVSVEVPPVAKVAAKAQPAAGAAAPRIDSPGASGGGGTEAAPAAVPAPAIESGGEAAPAEERPSFDKFVTLVKKGNPDLDFDVPASRLPNVFQVSTMADQLTSHAQLADLERAVRARGAQERADIEKLARDQADSGGAPSGLEKRLETHERRLVAIINRRHTQIRDEEREAVRRRELGIRARALRSVESDDEFVGARDELVNQAVESGYVLPDPKARLGVRPGPDEESAVFIHELMEGRDAVRARAARKAEPRGRGAVESPRAAAETDGSAVSVETVAENEDAGIEQFTERVRGLAASGADQAALATELPYVLDEALRLGLVAPAPRANYWGVESDGSDSSNAFMELLQTTFPEQAAQASDENEER
ncbi:MAG TPA: hypothetical protein VMT30_00665 [Candidatus Saccharimonadia bacterium]|nr:hypothetical protein [Candidatus Saccharimonadia bacterium]